MNEEYVIVPGRTQITLPSLGKTRFSLFGPNTYNGNVAEMEGEGYVPARTKDGIYLVSVALNHPKEKALAQINDIMRSNWVQAGRIVRGTEGVWVNPPRNKDGEFVIEEKKLKPLLHNSYLGVYFGKDQLAFAPYETFNQGVQSAEDFAKSGLARAMEYVADKPSALRLEAITNKQKREEANVLGFDPVSNPSLRVVGLDSYDDRLIVFGNDWDDDSLGSAFGGISGAEGTA